MGLDSQDFVVGIDDQGNIGGDPVRRDPVKRDPVKRDPVKRDPVWNTQRAR